MAPSELANAVQVYIAGQPAAVTVKDRRMCTVIILRRPDHDWPVILGANRDEMDSRPWRAPARHWPDRPNVIAGLDVPGGGSWLGLNDEGVFACILNREGTLGPQPGRRSRGELVLEALDHADAVEAAQALADLDPRAYRPFNLLVADNRDAFWLRHGDATGRQPVAVLPVPEGVSMLSARDLNDTSSVRQRWYLPRFRACPPPDPANGDWQGWEELLASRHSAPAGLADMVEGETGSHSALCITTTHGFATTSSALLALPAVAHPEVKPVWRFAPGRPDQTAWEAIHITP